MPRSRPDSRLNPDSHSAHGILRRKARRRPAYVLRNPACVLILCAAAILAIPKKCLAQDDATFHSCTVNAGGGWSPVHGTEQSNLNRGWNFHAGGGFAVTPRPAPGHNWSLFITANFMFDQLPVKPAALQQARTLDPQNIALQQASSAKANFYSTTLDPTLRFPARWGNVYAFGGFGWFRRSLAFTGGSSQGTLLQPGSPSVFGSGGNSGAFDAGVGVNVRPSRRTGGLMLYAEVRVLHGLAINHETMLVPVSFGVRW